MLCVLNPSIGGKLKFRRYLLTRSRGELSEERTSRGRFSARRAGWRYPSGCRWPCDDFGRCGWGG